MVSAFRNALDTLAQRIGLFDVVLPFLLVFAIVFAALEKSKVFGTSKIEGYEYTKKNLNAIVALARAFFVVASSKFVALITNFSAQASLIILFSVVFLMTAGLFFSDGNFFQNIEKYKGFWVWAIFTILVLIFLGALGWLGPVFGFITTHWQDSYVAALILLAIILGALFFITHSPNPTKKVKNKKEDE